MLLRNALRLLAIVAMVLAFGTATSAYAAVSPPNYFVAMQDLDDDDGEGIPNFLDPDYVPKEQIVEDEPVEPDPDDEVPTDEEPEPSPTNEPIPEVEEPTQDEEQSVPEATQTPQAAQVTILPDTGSGSGGVSLTSSGLISSTLLLLLFTAVIVRSQSRVP